MKDCFVKEPKFGSFFVIKIKNEEEYLVIGSRGDTHTITKNLKGKYSCSCKGYFYRGKCSHIERFLNHELKSFKSIMNEIDVLKTRRKGEFFKGKNRARYD